MIRILSSVLVLALVAACSPRSDAPPAAPEAGPVSGSPAAPPAVADDPAAYRGSALARQVCARCHDVGAGTASGETITAPAFADVAAGSDVTAQSLSDWMRASHPDMPNFMLGDSDVADLAAYIMSLRHAR